MRGGRGRDERLKLCSAANLAEKDRVRVDRGGFFLFERAGASSVAERTRSASAKEQQHTALTATVGRIEGGLVMLGEHTQQSGKKREVGRSVERLLRGNLPGPLARLVKFTSLRACELALLAFNFLSPSLSRRTTSRLGASSVCPSCS